MTDDLLDHPLISQRYFFPRPGALADPFWVDAGDARLACHLHQVDSAALTLVHFHGNGEVVDDYLDGKKAAADLPPGRSQQYHGRQCAGVFRSAGAVCREPSGDRVGRPAGRPSGAICLRRRRQAREEKREAYRWPGFFCHLEECMV